MLIAEDLLLLAIDGETGATRTRGGRLDYALAGALLSDLDLAGRVRLTTSNRPEHRKNRVVVDDPSPLGDPLLDAALDVLRTRDRSPAGAVRVLKRGLRPKLYQRLVDARVLRRDLRRLLGPFHLTRYPAINPAPAAAARAAITHDFRAAGGSDPRTSALIACLAVAGGVPDVVTELLPMLTQREIRRRARDYVDAHWPAKAARGAYLADASAASG